MNYFFYSYLKLKRLKIVLKINIIIFDGKNQKKKKNEQ